MLMRYPVTVHQNGPSYLVRIVERGRFSPIAMANTLQQIKLVLIEYGNATSGGYGSFDRIGGPSQPVKCVQQVRVWLCQGIRTQRFAQYGHPDS